MLLPYQACEMSINKLRGQFLQGKPKPKLKKFNDDNVIHYVDIVLDFSIYRRNGRVIPKRGAL